MPTDRYFLISENYLNSFTVATCDQCQLISYDRHHGNNQQLAWKPRGTTTGIVAQW